MALTKLKTSTKKYDDEECWNLAMSWGAAFTTNKLHRWHKENKGFGSHMGGIWAMWRWAAKNPELCYTQYKKFYFERNIGKTEWVNDNGRWVEKEVDPNISYEGFLRQILSNANGNDSILGKRSYRQFCAKHGLDDGVVRNEDIEVKIDNLARILIDRYGGVVGVDDIPDDLVPYYALMVIEDLQKEKNEAWKMKD